MNKQLISKIRKLCAEFENELHDILHDPDMDAETYESKVVAAAIEARFAAIEATMREC